MAVPDLILLGVFWGDRGDQSPTYSNLMGCGYFGKICQTFIGKK